MREVYSHAHFTIAATAARDGRDGLFCARENPRLAPVQVFVSWKAEPPPTIEATESPFWFEPGTYFVCDSASDTTDINFSPLNKRAWVVQERYLSTRIMHFARQVLYWECYEQYASEIYPHGIPEVFEDKVVDVKSLRAASLDHRLYRVQSHQQPRVNGLESIDLKAQMVIYSRWLRLRTMYSACYRSHDDDLLVALMGMATDVAEMLYNRPGQHLVKEPQTMSDVFIAGMWKLFLLEELCWSTWACKEDAFRKGNRDQAPTWSWASSTNVVHGSQCRVTYSLSYYPELLARIFHIDPLGAEEFMQPNMVRYSSRVIDVQEGAQRTGAVMDSFIILECRPFLAKIHLSSNRKYAAFENPWYLDLSALNRYGTETCNIVRIDYAMPDDVIEVTGINLLYTFNERLGTRCVEGLILKPSPRHPGSYVRIGHYTSYSTQDPHVPSSWVWDRHEEADVKEITIF